MSAIAECTMPEMILLAALGLEEQGQSPFSAEALIVASWRKSPRAFGLKGYTDQYPDSNKVLASIMGQRGLARRAWLVKVGQKVYSLSREGRLAAEALRGPAVAPAAEAVVLPPEQDRLLGSLLVGGALHKFQQGRKHELRFADACGFWDVAQNVHGEALDDRLDRFHTALTELKRLLGTTGATLADGRRVSPEQVADLCQLHSYLEGRFVQHLNVLRKRVERN